MSGLPAGLSLYRAATRVLTGWAEGHLASRAARGKEDPARLAERLGTAPADRPTGPLVWLHGASVGESLVALSVARGLLDARADLTCLLTSGTLTSATLIARHIGPRLHHRFVPIDTPRATAAFLDAWKPDAGVFIESDLWPNLILAARDRAIPLALLNGRMNARSVRNWARVLASAEHLIGAFTVLQAADRLTTAALSDFAHRDVPLTGNLKLAAAPPTVDEAERARLSAAIGKRPVWLAASTHEGEEEVVLAAHAALLTAAPDALLVLAPRHPDRSVAVQLAIRKAGQSVAIRSQNQTPTSATQVLLWDTLGELGLAYALAPVSLVGGSLVPGIGGHNPVEPAQLGSAILTGPFRASFADLYDTLEAAQAARILPDANPTALAAQIAGLWGNEAGRAAQCSAARAVVAEGAGALQGAVSAVLALLPDGTP